MAGARKKKAKRGGTRAKAPARVRPAVRKTKKPSVKKSASHVQGWETRRANAAESEKSPAKKKTPKKAHRSPVKHRAQSTPRSAGQAKKKKLPKKAHRSTAKQTQRGHQEHLAHRRSRAAERREALKVAKTAATAKRRAAALKGWKAHRVRQREGFDRLKNTLTWYKDRGESSSYELFRNLKRQLFETNELDPSHPNYLPADTIEDILIQAALDAGWDELHAARFAKDS